MRNVLNVVVDILTLLAIAVSGVGHMLPWFNANYSRFGPIHHWEKERFIDDKQGRLEREQKMRQEEDARRERALALMEFQLWHAMRSGAALCGLCLLVFLSLGISWNRGQRRFLVLLMFLCALTAIAFITLSFSWYPITEEHKTFAGTLREDTGFLVALVPACFALAFCLIRMIWTMPPSRPQPETVNLVGRPEQAPMRPMGDLGNPGLYRPRE